MPPEPALYRLPWRLQLLPAAEGADLRQYLHPQSRAEAAVAAAVAALNRRRNRTSRP